VRLCVSKPVDEMGEWELEMLDSCEPLVIVEPMFDDAARMWALLGALLLSGMVEGVLVAVPRRDGSFELYDCPLAARRICK